MVLGEQPCLRGRMVACGNAWRLARRLTLGVWLVVGQLGILVRRDDEEVELMRCFTGVLCMLKLNFGK